MTSADAKANIKQQEIKDLVVVSCKFLQEVPSKLETQCNKGVHIFHLFLVGIPSIMILSVKNRVSGRGWRGLLNRQNLLIVTKVICRQSLTVYSVLTLT